MKNNVIELYPQFNKASSHRTSLMTSTQSSICGWITTIINALYTLTISACTVFCVYLAYTML